VVAPGEEPELDNGWRAISGASASTVGEMEITVNSLPTTAD
jgi:hypothetical protein